MRYDAEHKQKTRERVLTEAAKAMRAEGPHKIAVAGVMAKAGLTHGGFYAHFPSREAFVAETIGQMFAEGRAQQVRRMADLPPREALSAYLEFYLSTAHRDATTSGCPLPFLSADAPRLEGEARARYAAGVAGLAGALAAQFRKQGRAEPDTDGYSMLAEMVGALALARAEPDRARSDAILAHSRQSLSRRFDLELKS
ncbi:MAG: TetR/AcrR family transcriptional regulator [Caulobacterales bacterium]|nr:TetR/AcrR family transcriptional regulator [Caulobacterales bacterium]